MKYSTVILNGEKAVQNETNYTLRDKTGIHREKIARILDGATDVHLSDIASVANALGLEVVVEFQKVEELAAQS